MPDLPTLTLSQEHYDRVVAAFPGATGASKATAYNNWLTNQLIDFVRSSEQKKIEDKFAIDKQTQMAAVDASLPSKLPFPPP